MEDLDALLADLQNTTAHLQNHRENSRFSNSPGSPKPTFNNSYSYQDDSAPVYQNQKMMREMTVTTKTNYHVPGSGSGAGSPTPINSNLSELDNLLEDLNTARYPPPPPPATQHQQHYPQHYENRVPTSPSLNGPNGRYSGGSDSRPSVESLLDELQSAVPTSPSNSRRGANRTPERYVVNTVTTTTVTHPHPQHQPVGRQSPAPNPAASSATKELDDLMASLSDFKLNAAGSPQTSDSLYAKPNKPKSSQSQTRTQTQTRARTPDNAQIGDNQLDSMLGTLQSDMSKQGVNTAQKGCCAACSKPIVGQVVTALAKTWHPEHFVCAHCNQELGTKNFFERDGRPYCEPDYHNLFSPRCAYCNGPILDKCVSALDKTWHPEHFFCAQCGGQFGEDGFHEKDGKPYCRNDYFQMFAPKCGGCNRPIMENYISALNSQWHPDCFVCRDCRTPFNGGSFFDHDGQPYCETHYHAKRGSLCAGCQKPITGRCITAMFRKFHPEHFVCSFCLKQLNKGTFKEQNDKPYCHPCFEKLFG